MLTPTTTDADHGARQQEPSSISSGRLRLTDETARLYDHYWPPVPTFTGLGSELAAFIRATPEEQQLTLTALRDDPEAHGSFLHRHLATIYADWFGYRDGSSTAETNDDGEAATFAAKIKLERELFDHWVEIPSEAEFANQLAAANYLDEMAATNPGVGHALFEYLRDEAPRENVEIFLQCELIRNEVVDDEVALLTVGLQGAQKAVAVANLWDECGRGRLENFHTYWLRRLLQGTDGWDSIYTYRQQHPWFAKITSNTNASLLTRPSRKLMAYGCFLIFESWVAPHFERILAGMSRVGMLDQDMRIYFAAHVRIDPRHSRELSDALRVQRPELEPDEIREVVYGAQLAASAGKRQFDHMLTYLRSLPIKGPRP